MAAHPEAAGLVASPGGAVEPLVHAPEAVQAARVSGIGVVNRAVIERERAHARPVALERGGVGSGHGRYLGFSSCAAAFLACAPRQQLRLAPVIIFNAPLALLRLGEPDLEVGVEVGAGRRGP